MTAQADQLQTTRQAFAVPGSRHDKIMGFLGRILPSAIGVLAAFLALAPLLQRSEISFLLDKNSVEIARERMRVTEALYRGESSKGQPFSLKAGSAVQRTSAVPVVELKDLSARILFDSGPGVLTANEGTYDMDSEQVQVQGPVQFNSANGYRLVTRDVDVDLSSRNMSSRGRVDGRTPAGTFSADRLSADLNTRTITLEGRARLRMEQGASRLAR